MRSIVRMRKNNKSLFSHFVQTHLSISPVPRLSPPLFYSAHAKGLSHAYYIKEERERLGTRLLIYGIMASYACSACASDLASLIMYSRANNCTRKI